MNIEKYRSLPISYTVNSETTTKDTRFLNITIDVLHTGKNFNGSIFTKEVVDANIGSIKNTPILGYIQMNDDGSLGDFDQHNYKLVKRDGEEVYIYAGQAYGVIPESCNPRWIEKVSSDGHLREYLQVDALLWTKFKDATDIFRRDKIKNQSMELEEASMQGYEQEDYSFIFTDFKFDGCCILSTSDPCIQPAMIDSIAVSHFSANSIALEIKQKLNEYTQVSQHQSSNTEVEINIQPSQEGGTNLLNKDELLKKYSVKIEDFGFSIEGLSPDELEQKLIDLKSAKDTQAKNYALDSQLSEALYDAISKEKIETEYGLASRYSMIDYDMGTFEVYCYDRTDWVLYGFGFQMDGDTVKIDYACKKRKKYAIVDFLEGTDQERTLEVYSKDALDAALAHQKEQFTDIITEANEAASEAYVKFEKAEATIAELSEFKQAVLKTEREEAEVELFSRFKRDLEGIKEYEELKAQANEYSIEALQEKCFSIWGKTKATFSVKEPKMPVKLPVETTSATADEPYGGLFAKYKNI